MPTHPPDTPGFLDRGRVRLLGGLVLLAAGWFVVDRLLVDRTAIVVGLLHSRTGPDAATEEPMLEAEIAALTEINTGGGLLGRPVRWVVADGASDPQSFARQAARLIRDEGVCVLFGCWRTPGRKAVLRVVEANDHLLVFPARYEGLEQSRHVVYAGPVASQFVGPGVRWLTEDRGARRFFLVTADDTWGRSVEAIAEDLLIGLGCEIIGRSTVTAEQDLVTTAAAIAAARPDAVISMLEWPISAKLSRSLRGGGVRSETTPLLVLPLSAHVVPGGESMTGAATVVATSAGPSSPTVQRAPGSPGEATAGARTAVGLWAQAVRNADTTDVRQVREAIRYGSLAEADGLLAVDPESQHTWQRMRVAVIRPDGQEEDAAKPVPAPLRPFPFPTTRSRSQWEQFTAVLVRRWGGSWAPPTAIGNGTGDSRPGQPPSPERGTVR